MFSYAAPLGLLLVVVIAIAAIWSGRLSNRGQSIFWGLWSAGFIAALSGIGLYGCYGAGAAFSRGNGPSLAGLAGLVLLILAIGAFGIAAGCFFIMRKKLKAAFAWPGVWLGFGLGSLAITISSAILEARANNALREDWTIVVRDEEGQPVEGANVSWQIYEYDHPYHNANENKLSRPVEAGGPLKSDASGKAILHGWTGTYETIGAVERPGYIPVNFEIGMTFDHNNTRDFSFKSKSNSMVRGSARLPKQGPFSFAICLPSDKTLHEAEDRSALLYFDLGEQQARTLLLWTSDGQVHRVRASVVKYKAARESESLQLRMVGLDGLTLCEGRKQLWATSDEAGASVYLKVAPDSGYEPSIDLKFKESENGYYTIFSKTAEGRYAQLEIGDLELSSARRRAVGHDGTFKIDVSWNTAGGRSCYCKDLKTDILAVQNNMKGDRAVLPVE